MKFIHSSPPSSPTDKNSVKPSSRLGWGGFARLIRKPFDLKEMQWVLGALIAIAVDAKAHAEGVDDFKLELKVANDQDDGINQIQVLDFNDVSSGDGKDLNADKQIMVVELPSRSKHLPKEIRKLVADIALAPPLEADALLKDFQEHVTAQFDAKKAREQAKPAEGKAGPKPIAEEKSLDLAAGGGDQGVFDVVRQAAVEMQGGDPSQGFSISSADLNELIPLQFVDEKDQEILWAKNDDMPWWYGTPLAGLLGFLGGGGAAAGAAAGFSASNFAFAGVLLEDAVANADVYIETTSDGGQNWTLTAYKTTTDANGKFNFSGIDSSIIAKFNDGTARIHALAGGTDTYTGNTVGDFYISFKNSQFQSSQQVVVDPISLISALTGQSESTLKSQLFGAAYANVVFDAAYLASNPLVQDAIRQI